MLRKILYGITLLLFLIVAILSFKNFFDIKNEIQEEQVVHNELIDISEIPEEINQEENFKINFDELLSINSDVIGWIVIEGTNINYPIVQSKNNTYYLKHSFYKKYSNYGTIYIDATANKDFTSQNTFIYGHYTANKSMFGELGNYMKQSFFEEHPYFIIYTPEKTLKMEIFSVHVDSASSPSYQMNFTTEDAFKNYIALMKEKSVINSNVTVNYSADRIVTLYSCSRETNYHKQDRYYIHAKIIES